MSEVIPPGAHIHIPVLIRESSAYWPDGDVPTMAAQVEAESNWNPRAKREAGKERSYGLAQIAIVEGRFNNYQTAGNLDKTLEGWMPPDYYRADYQLRALVIIDRMAYNNITFADDDQERRAMMLVSYNSGYGGLLASRAMCRSVPGCDQTKWFGHLELYGKQSRKPLAGLKKSAFQVSREYPGKVLQKRDKYVRLLWLP